MKIIFRKEKAIHFSDAELVKNKTIIPLEITDNSLIYANPSLRKDGDNLFVFSNYSASPILHFDTKGNFINVIGRIGNGPGEYANITDVFVHAKKDYVEVLSNKMIQRYAYDGKPLEHLHVDISVFSFVHTDDGYWFYGGNNKMFSPYRLFQTDSSCNSIREYLTDDSEMLPMMETNFGNGAYLTFWESLYHKIYHITNDSLKLSYTVEFPGLEIPSDAHKMPPMEVIPYLKRFHYATIRCYLENQKYVYLMVIENKGDDMPAIYHWFINKLNGHETIIQTDLILNSYLLSPQLLTEDNGLYYIGYPIENREEEVNPDSNPSIVMIDISDM
jgi:hypothetical protein